MAKDLKFSITILFCVLAALIVGFLTLPNTIQLPTGAATTQTTTSRVAISYYFAISLSTNLSEGIDFGNITSLPANDLNATHNYDGANGTTSFWVHVSNDSNVNVDICHRAQGPLTTVGNDTIELGNYTWSDSLTNTNLLPAGPPGSNTFTTSFVKGNNVNIAPGNNGYYRYWLDIPLGQPAGTYNNIIEYKAVYAGVSC
ncbi:MAG: hypothetical protein QW063_00755 [Candidatus Nanoarchaeia archaeon]